MVSTNFFSRMVAEYYELCARIERAMERYSQDHDDTPSIDTQMLGDQIIAMTKYAHALEARMRYYKIPYRNVEADCSGGYDHE